MKTTDALLEFVLRFAQMALPIRKAEWDKLRRDIAAFVGYGRPMVPWGTKNTAIVFNESNPLESTKEEIGELQKDVTRLVVPRLDPRVARVFHGGIGHVWEGGVRIVTEWATLVGVGTQQHFIVKGETQDLFLAFVLNLLMQTPADRIRRCPALSKRNPAEQCGRLFLRTGRKLYCSETCTNRANKQDQRRNQRRKKRPARKNGANAA